MVSASRLHEVWMRRIECKDLVLILRKSEEVILLPEMFEWFVGMIWAFSIDKI